jgi:hypothetical protein
VDTTKTGGISHKRIKIKKAIPVLKYQVMRMYGGVEVKFHTFLALVIWSSVVIFTLQLLPYNHGPSYRKEVLQSQSRYDRKVKNLCSYSNPSSGIRLLTSPLPLHLDHSM